MLGISAETSNGSSLALKSKHPEQWGVFRGKTSLGNGRIDKTDPGKEEVCEIGLTAANLGEILANRALNRPCGMAGPGGREDIVRVIRLDKDADSRVLKDQTSRDLEENKWANIGDSQEGSMERWPARGEISKADENFQGELIEAEWVNGSN